MLKLVTKTKFQEKNNISSDDTFAKLLESITYDQEKLNEIIEKQNTYIENEIGAVSPFFFRAVEQYQNLILDNYTAVKKAFLYLKNEFNEVQFKKFYQLVENLDTACGKFSELLIAEAHKYNNQDVKIDRLESLYEKINREFDVHSIDSNLEVISDAFSVLDILLCPQTFEEIKDMSHTDLYWSYANYFFTEYTLLFDPTMFIQNVMEKEES